MPQCRHDVKTAGIMMLASDEETGLTMKARTMVYLDSEKLSVSRAEARASGSAAVEPSIAAYLRIVGLGSSGRSDVAERHDAYLGQVLLRWRPGRCWSHPSSKRPGTDWTWGPRSPPGTGSRAPTRQPAWPGTPSVPAGSSTCHGGRCQEVGLAIAWSKPRAARDTWDRVRWSATLTRSCAARRAAVSMPAVQATSCSVESVAE